MSQGFRRLLEAHVHELRSLSPRADAVAPRACSQQPFPACVGSSGLDSHTRYDALTDHACRPIRPQRGGRMLPYAEGQLGRVEVGRRYCSSLGGAVRTAFEVPGSGPSSDEGVDQGLAFLLIEHLALRVSAKMTAQDGLELSGGYAAFLRHCDKFDERR